MKKNLKRCSVYIFLCVFSVSFLELYSTLLSYHRKVGEGGGGTYPAFIPHSWKLDFCKGLFKDVIFISRGSSQPMQQAILVNHFISLQIHFVTYNEKNKSLIYCLAISNGYRSSFLLSYLLLITK